MRNYFSKKLKSMLLVLILSNIEGVSQPAEQNKGLNELIENKNEDTGRFFNKNRQMQ